MGLSLGVTPSYRNWATLGLMWAWIWSLAAAGAADCPLRVVQPEAEQAVQSPVMKEGELRGLPRGSLVRLRPDLSCEEGVGVEVVSVVYFYAEPGLTGALPGGRGCLSEDDLVGTEPYRFIALPPPPGAEKGAIEAGQVLEDLVDAGACDGPGLQFGEDVYPLSDLRWLRALSPSLLAESLVLQAEWIQRYGPVMTGRIWLSDWGYLALPMLRFRDGTQLEAEWEREDLESPEQRERAVSAIGPSSLWLHFLGADARFSDLWARPETVASLAKLAQAWSYWCPGQDLADRERCTLQIGDLAWYNSREPDPLGHTEHSEGRCVDLRLFRQDGSRYEAYWNREDDRPGRGPGYDPVLTREFLNFSVQNFDIETIYFNDPDVAGAVAARGHDDHIHLCFAPVTGSADD